MEGSSGGSSRSCGPQGPHGSAGDSGSASQASSSAAEGCCRPCMPGQTTCGFNTGSCLGASSSWSYRPALRSERWVSCYDQDGERTSRSQTPKEALKSPEPLTKNKNKIETCKNKCRKGQEGAESQVKRDCRGVPGAGRESGPGSELLGADTALDGAQEGASHSAPVTQGGQTQLITKPSGNHLLPAPLHPTLP